MLDEPTNDLDLETLELLEAQLVEWPGTLLLVSHDRAFLDNVVTSTFVFEGDGRVQEYVGGYEDWLRQRRAACRFAGALQAPTAPAEGVRTGPKKLSYREQRELDELPARIEALEAEQRTLGSDNRGSRISTNSLRPRLPQRSTGRRRSSTSSANCTRGGTRSIRGHRPPAARTKKLSKNQLIRNQTGNERA